MNAADADGDDVKMAIGTMRGYRTWFPGMYGRLASITAGTSWTSPDPGEAKCYRNNLVSTGKLRTVGKYSHEGREAPVKECSCGFYAYHKPPWMSPQGTNVCGVVEAWGRIIVGPEGFRSQRIRIVALACEARGQEVRPAVILMKQRMESAMSPFDPHATLDVIAYKVGWPDGTATQHELRLTRYDNRYHVRPDPLDRDDVLLAYARREYPDKARMERAWPVALREVEDLFGLRVYPDVLSMIRDFPPQNSELIPKPKATPEQRDARNYVYGGAVPSGQYQVSLTVNPTVTAQAYRNVVVSRNPNSTFTWSVT